jgi:cadmium resistance protein CadD (predicted permease)
VGDLAGPILAVAAVFAGTNVDDVIVLTVLFLAARASGRPRVWQVWAGQYGGMAALIAISAAAALGLVIVPDRWVGLLGLIPFGLGVAGLVATSRARGREEPPVVATGLASVVGITLANGADNLAVYTPMFRTIGVADSVVTIAVFLALVAPLCLAGSVLGSHPRVVAVVRRYGHWIVPVVFIALGLIVLASVLG